MESETGDSKFLQAGGRGAHCLSAGVLLDVCTTDCPLPVTIAQAEMRQGLSYFHSTIFNSLPTFYRRIDTALKQVHAPLATLVSAIVGPKRVCSNMEMSLHACTVPQQWLAILA